MSRASIFPEHGCPICRTPNSVLMAAGVDDRGRELWQLSCINCQSREPDQRVANPRRRLTSDYAGLVARLMGVQRLLDEGSPDFAAVEDAICVLSTSRRPRLSRRKEG